MRAQHALIAAGLAAIAAALGPQTAAAAPLAPQSAIPEASGLVEMVQKNGDRRRHRHRHGPTIVITPGVVGGGGCGYWRRECGDRHGWRTRSYYRCLGRHGC
jgi:hypothetical protein